MVLYGGLQSLGFQHFYQEFHPKNIEKYMTLTLSEWYDIMGINPWHGFQLTNATIPIDSKCNTLVYERAWLDADRVGRKEIRRAINRAEELIYQYVGYWPSKRYREITIEYPRLGNHTLVRTANYDPTGHWVSIQLPEGHVHQLGYLHNYSAVTVDVEYSDEDGDTIYETATVTAQVPSGTLTSEVVAQFISDDLGTLSESPDIPIRNVTIVGTTATITFDSWNLVKPIKYQGVKPISLNPNSFHPQGNQGHNHQGHDHAQYVMALEINVFRRRVDPTGTTQDTSHAVFIWESQPWPRWCSCCYNLPNAQASDPSALRYAIARGGVRNSSAGIIYLGDAIYDETSQTWSGKVDWSTCRPPDRVHIRYEAGSTDNAWKTVVARLAAAELTRPICACANANKELAEWQWDLSRNGGTDEVYSSPQDLTNPLGARRGHIYAWRTIQRLQRTIGIIA